MNIAPSLGLAQGPATRNAFGEALAELGAAFPGLVVVDGDVGNSTRTEVFGKRYPERFFNVGIAESNLVGVAAGLASCGHIALAASFAAFLLQEVKKECHLAGRVRAARTSVDNIGSRAALRKAGLRECGFMLTGALDFD